MNDPEVTMNNALPKNNLIAAEKAIEAAAAAISIVRRVPAPLKTIADRTAICACLHRLVPSTAHKPKRRLASSAKSAP